MSGNPFEDLSDVYEVLVDWPQRLARETPFYRQWWERVGVRRVLDAACGTGQHAALFAAWGLSVEGADGSERMIAKARSLHGETGSLRWIVRRFEEACPTSAAFDAAICVGNSLALAPDEASAERAIGNLLAAVRRGGVVVVQVLNVWSLPDGPCHWQKGLRAVLPQGEAVIVKGVHRCGPRGYVDLVVVPLGGWPAKSPPLRAESVPLLGLEATTLDQWTRRAGAGKVAIFGDYLQRPYERERSLDLILVAEK